MKSVGKLKLDHISIIAIMFGVFICCRPSTEQQRVFSLKKIADSNQYILVKVEDIKDTVEAIQELLAYQGDTSLIYGGVVCTNPSWSFIYRGEKKLSVQVAALHKINSLLSEDLFFHSPFPVLENSDGKLCSTSGEMVDKAFEYYKPILKDNKIVNRSPLDEKDIKWHWGNIR